MMLVFIESPVNVVKNKKVNSNDNQTGNNRKTCKFYERFDSMLESKPATRSPTVINFHLSL